MTSPRVPEIEAGWALFLDLDGTLLDMAPTPDAVRVPPGLIDSLGGVGERLGGALAIVTGRARETVDRLLAPLAPPGVMLERKPHGLALHYRAAPERAEAARAALEALLAEEGGDFALLPAHMAFEIRPRRATKARAVEALMRIPPFRGRCPVFVGDDVTDEAGMEAARRHGGLGLHVGRDFAGGPAEVRAWLARALARLPAGGAHVHA